MKALTLVILWCCALAAPAAQIPIPGNITPQRPVVQEPVSQPPVPNDPQRVENTTLKPLLWRDPGSIGEKNLTYGAGSAERAPAPPFTFLKEDMSGSKPKIRVRDAKGIEWNVKFAGEAAEKNEVHAEVAASRIIWALGYRAEENYYIPEGVIEGADGKISRARSSIDRNGRFRIARFERRDANVSRTDQRWSVDENPFKDSKELSGLKILTALINNWDNKIDNTAVERVSSGSGEFEEWYLFSDLGAAFGRMAGPPSWSPAPSRFNVKHYAEQRLLDGADDSSIDLYYLGQLKMDKIPLDHARWFAGLVSQLRPEQLRAAFEAAGAPPADAEQFAARFMEKVAELNAAVGLTRD